MSWEVKVKLTPVKTGIYISADIETIEEHRELLGVLEEAKDYVTQVRARPDRRRAVAVVK